MEEQKKIIYTWEQFEKDIKEIQKFCIPYTEGNLIKNVYGIPRGGVVLAVSLSHLLDIPFLISKKQIGKKTLVVDDISDTGNTLFKFLKEKQCFGVVTLFMNQKSKFKPIMYCRKVEDWVVFPWETDKSSKRDN